MLARIRANGIEPSIPLARGDGVRRAFITDPDDHTSDVRTRARVANRPAL
jgi:hypothetical protein